MSEESKPQAFLDRWSKRKQAHAEQEQAKQEAPPVVPPLEAAPPAPLPAIEDLKPDSDFKPFMDPRVDTGTRRSALKKLFTDAHFSAIDPFEPYSIDLTGEDPIPEEMLKTLDHAKRLLFDEPEKKVEAATAPLTEEHEQDAKDPGGKQDA